MKRILTIVLILFSIAAHSQTAQWTNTFGSSIDQNQGKSTTVDAAGNVYVTGYFSGEIAFGAFALKSAGNEDIFIVKYNSSGVVQWAKRAGGAENDGGTGIAVSGTSVYVTGYMYGSANFNNPSATGSSEITSAGYKDIYIAKYDDAGVFQWAKRAGGTQDDISNAIAISGTSVYITGRFSETANFNNPSATGSNEIISVGSSDIFIAKYNDAGIFQWTKRAGGVYGDVSNGIAVNGTSIYITGGFIDKANFNNPSAIGSNEITSAGSSDIFIAKFNDIGNFQWAKRAGGSSEDISNGIAVNGTSVYITGHFGSTANFNTPSATGSNEITSAGYKDIFLAKFNDAGTFQWARRAGGSDYYEDISYGIAVNGASIYITGSFDGTANFNTPSATGSNEIIGQDDIFIAKFSDTGNFQWARKASGSYNEDQGKAIAVNNTDIYCVGGFRENIIFSTSTGNNTVTLSSKGLSAFVAKYEETGILQWANTTELQGGDDLGRGTATDAAGNVYVTGEFRGKITIESTTIYSAGGADIFVAKYNNTGILQWLKRAGGVGDDKGFGIAVDGTSVYVTGYFKNTANFNTPSATGTNEIISAGSIDIFLAKFNDEGTCQWVKRAGGNGNGYDIYKYDKTFLPFQQSELGGNWGDSGMGVAVSGNAVYITGTFLGTINFNTPSATGSNEITSAVIEGDNYSNDIFIAKYNESGIFQWAKRAGGKNDDVANGIAVNGNSIYITGLFTNIANFNTPSSSGSNEITPAGVLGTADIFIAKYNDAGTFQWAKRAGGDGGDAGFQIAANGTSIYIIGSFAAQHEYTYFDPNYNSTANFNTPSSTGSNELIATGLGHNADIFIAKYNDAGTFQWAKRAGGSDHDVGYGLVVNGSSVYISGGINGNANFNTPSATGINEINSNGGIDVFIAKFDDAGVFQWARDAGNQYGHSLESGYSVAFNNNICYVTGCFFVSSNFSYGGNNHPKNSNGRYDVFLSAIFDGSLSTSAVAGSPFCQGSNIPVSFTSTGTFGVGNLFTAQLLKSGQVVSTATGTIPISLPIPANTAVSSDYRVRVIASNPAIPGSDNGINLSVISGSKGGDVVGDKSVNAGVNSTTLSLTGYAGNIIKWQSSSTSTFSSTADIANTANSLTVNNLMATTYYRAVVQNGVCPIDYSLSGQVSVTPAPTTSESITITPKGIYNKPPTDANIDTTNISYGKDAFIANTKAKDNIAIGTNSLKKQAFSNSNTAYTSGNIAIGYESLASSNSTLTTNGIKNIGVGSFTLQKNTTGTDGIGMGFGALNRNTSGNKNIGIGTNAASSLISSSGNTIIGFQALKTNTFGADNTAFGAEALNSNLLGNQNVSFGYKSLFYSTGGANTGVGFQAGYSNLGLRNVLIGSEAGLSSNTSDLLIIENSDSLNALIVGNFAANKIGINRSKSDLDLRAETFQVSGDAFKELGTGNWVIPSDRRLKTNISYLNSQTMLQQVMRLKGAGYQWKDKSRGTGPLYGFIAQELHRVFPENIKKDKEGYLSATYGNMDAAFVESIKALEHRNQTLESTNEELRKRIHKLKQQLIAIEKMLNTAPTANQTTIQTDR